ncbi:MAG TPA: potassium channel family protein [Gaiellaceae bacterium]|nr:potassium channel family protein [Gaiellaceae bacterium]
MQEGWYPGRRVERLHASHSYGFVLALVLAAFLWGAVAPEGAWERTVLVALLAGTLATAAWTSGLGRLAILLSGGLVAVALVLGIVATQTGKTVTGSLYVLGAIFVLTSVGVIGLGVFDQRAVNLQAVLGAVSAYLLLGLLFTCAYGSMAALGSGDLFVQGTDGTLSLRLYFSYVTLTTVGYGDYTLSTNFGHTVAVLEALTGQLYLVTVVATLVSRMPARSAA